MNDDYNSISVAPKTSSKSKNGTLSDSQIAKSVLLNNVGFNRERTNKRNVLNDVDFNEVRMPISVKNNNFRSRNLMAKRNQKLED